MPRRYRLMPGVGMTPPAPKAHAPCANPALSRHDEPVSEDTSTDRETSAEAPIADDHDDPAEFPSVDGRADGPTNDQLAPRKRRFDKTTVIVSLVVGLGLALVTRGVLVGVTGDDRSPLPDAVERVEPVPDAEQVLSQSGVFVDLAAGYTGELTIDGVEIPTIDVSEVSSDRVTPGEQVDIPPGAVYEPGNATLTFIPSDGAPITQFAEGIHRASVRYWALDESDQRARTYSWTFNVI